MDISTHYSDPPWGWDLTLPSKLVRACARARFHGLVLDNGDSSPCISRHTVKNPFGEKVCGPLIVGCLSSQMSVPDSLGPSMGASQVLCTLSILMVPVALVQLVRLFSTVL